MFVDLAEIPVDVGSARVYEHGWQSWSPSGVYPVTATSFRPSVFAPEHGFQGEGLLAVDTGSSVHVFSAASADVASIRASPVDGRVVVSADGPVSVLESGGPLDEVLAA